MSIMKRKTLKKVAPVKTQNPIAHNGPAIKQVAEGNLPEGRSDRRERSFIACWALLNGA